MLYYKDGNILTEAAVRQSASVNAIPADLSMQGATDVMLSYGYLPVTEIKPEKQAYEKYTNPIISVTDTEAIAAYNVAHYSNDEIAQLRQAAYKEESDPKYLEAVYDGTEEAMQAWKDKVTEIKARYPYADETTSV